MAVAGEVLAAPMWNTDDSLAFDDANGDAGDDSNDVPGNAGETNVTEGAPALVPQRPPAPPIGAHLPPATEDDDVDLAALVANVDDDDEASS